MPPHGQQRRGAEDDEPEDNSRSDSRVVPVELAAAGRDDRRLRGRRHCPRADLLELLADGRLPRLIGERQLLGGRGNCPRPDLLELPLRHARRLCLGRCRPEQDAREDDSDDGELLHDLLLSVSPIPNHCQLDEGSVADQEQTGSNVPIGRVSNKAVYGATVARKNGREERMEYRVLGSLEVVDGRGLPLALGGARQQSVLASLILRAGRTVPLERLVEELWEKPPKTAEKTVQVYVSRLRRQLEARAIESRPGGYALVLDGDQLDLARFEQMSGEGHEALGAGDCERAATLLRDALALWRGPALSGLQSPTLCREAERLEELRLQALEDRLEADLGRGHERAVVAEVQPLVTEHPFRERLRGLLMLALYRSGRQTEALDVYRETRSLLADQLGLEPSETLRELERRVLAHDPQLEVQLPDAQAPSQSAARPQEERIRARRPATVVFADLVGSTGLGEQLDPETVHAVLDRYSRISTAVLERHGGTVEKFIGDAVFGIFGLTALHEDDALRAVRAAVELRDAAAELGEELKRTHGIDFAVKLGVNSGDVFVGSGSNRGVFATGDPVNVAARLEQVADAHEILLGE